MEQFIPPIRNEKIFQFQPYFELYSLPQDFLSEILPLFESRYKEDFSCNLEVSTLEKLFIGVNGSNFAHIFHTEIQLISYIVHLSDIDTQKLSKFFS